MAKIETKFDVGDTVYYLHYKAELDEADVGGVELFQTLMNNLRKAKVSAISFHNSGMEYELVPCEYVKEKELFATEEEAFLSLITDLKERLESNLGRTEELLMEVKEDFASYRNSAFGGKNGEN